MEMKFYELSYETKIDDLLSAGYEDGDFVLLLSSDGTVNHGRLLFITEYSTLFDIQVVISDYKTLDVASARGISKLKFE